MNIEIVKAKKEMAQEIALVHIRSWQSTYKGIISQYYLDNLSVESRAQRYRFGKDMGDGHHFYAVKIGNEMIGLLHLCPCRDDGQEGCGEISSIYLLPEYWGMGYGSYLMEYALDVLKNDGYKTIKIWVLEQNKRAIKCYQKFGFEFDGTKKVVKIGDEVTEVRYSKRI